MKKAKVIILTAVIVTAAMLVNVSTAYAQQCKTISEKDLEKICTTAGEEFGICPELLQALVETESSCKIYAKNGDCCGLAQISTKWHEERMEDLGITNIFDPESNVRLAASYLAELFAENEDIYYVLMRYNMKKSTADTLYDKEQYTEYAIKITERSADLERKHGK